MHSSNTPRNPVGTPLSVALVLPGGGADGAYQAGSLEAVYSRERQGWFRIVKILGISVGSLNGALYAQAQHERMQHLWHTISKRDVFKGHPLWNALLMKAGLHDNAPLRGLIQQHLQHYWVVPFECGAVDMQGVYRHFLHTDPDILEGILASTSIPVTHTPTRINGKLWMDGGVVNISPISRVLGADVDCVMMVNPYPDQRHFGQQKRWWWLPVGQRAIGIMLQQQVQGDVEAFHRTNRIVNQHGSMDGTLVVQDETGAPKVYRSYLSVEIRPSYAFAKQYMGDGMDFSRSRLSALYNQGREDAFHYLDLFRQIMG